MRVDRQVCSVQEQIAGSIERRSVHFEIQCISFLDQHVLRHDAVTVVFESLVDRDIDINEQISDEEYIGFSDYIIDNSSDLSEAEKRVDELMEAAVPEESV